MCVQAGGWRDKETDYCTCEGQGAVIQNTIKVTGDSRSSGCGKQDTEPGGKIFNDRGVTRWSEDNSIKKELFNSRQVKVQLAISCHK